jgi:DNA polymerase V
MSAEKTYLAIDLKSFYASVECAARNLDPLNANLVVADQTRTNKTICLAVSPALKQFGVPGRPRLYEVEQRVAQLNRARAKNASYHHLAKHGSIFRGKLLKSPNLPIEYRVAKPRMNFYLQKSAEIYEIYLRYLPPSKIHVYSIDEVMMDVTDYLREYQVTARALAKDIIQTISAETRITATAGIGTNLYLAKVAMDIVAKRIPGDEDGVRIAAMDEMTYRKYLWAHQPLTDFWRVGRGYAKRLEKLGLSTMGDIARCSMGTLSDKLNEEVLYREFGKNAEILIDHAWGYESATIEDIKNYRSAEHGIYSGQVLMKPYTYSQARLVVKEMVNSLALQLTKRQMVTDQVGLTIAYDISNVTKGYGGATTTDFYGRRVPKPLHKTLRFDLPTASFTELSHYFLQLYDGQVNRRLTIRKITVIANHLVSAEEARQVAHSEQLDLFSDPTRHERQLSVKKAIQEKDQRIQQLILNLQKNFGKNVIIRAADLKQGATLKERNNQIGGHQA